MTDVYVAMVSWAHNVAPKGYYIAIVSTIAESDSNHHLELQAGFDRLGKIEEKFMGPPIPIYEPLESGSNDNIFISRSYDATSHFETTTGKTSMQKRDGTKADMRYRRHSRHLQKSRGSRVGGRGSARGSEPCGGRVDDCQLEKSTAGAGMIFLFFLLI